MSFLIRSGTYVKSPRRWAMSSRWILANHSSTELSQDEYVGGEMRVRVRMIFKKMFDPHGLVSGEVAEYHVNLFATRLVDHKVGK